MAAALLHASHRSFTWLAGRIQRALAELRAAQAAGGAASTPETRAAAEAALAAAQARLAALDLPAAAIRNVGLYVNHIGGNLEQCDAFLADARSREDKAVAAAAERRELMAQRAQDKAAREAQERAAEDERRRKAQERGE